MKRTRAATVHRMVRSVHWGPRFASLHLRVASSYPIAEQAASIFRRWSFRALDVSGVGQALDSSTIVENELQALDQYTPSPRSNPAGTLTSTNATDHVATASKYDIVKNVTESLPCIGWFVAYNKVRASRRFTHASRHRIPSLNELQAFSGVGCFGRRMFRASDVPGVGRFERCSGVGLKHTS